MLGVNQRKRIRLVGVFLAALIGIQLIFASSAMAARKDVGPAPNSYQIKGVPLYAQQHNLSCEYAAARMVTTFWGNPISESQFIKAIPTDANPHLGFRGNIDRSGGGLSDYGIYAEPIANYLNTQGFNTKVFYGGATTLRQEIARGRPVIVWVTIALQKTTPKKVWINGSPVKLVPGEHAVVITGYDESGVYLNGPAQGIRTWFSWDDFMRTWSYFDQMALSVWHS
jgi:uncharacterized protein YvpB